MRMTQAELTSVLLGGVSMVWSGTEFLNNDHSVFLKEMVYQNQLANKHYYLVFLCDIVTNNALVTHGHVVTGGVFTEDLAILHCKSLVEDIAKIRTAAASPGTTDVRLVIVH